MTSLIVRQLAGSRMIEDWLRVPEVVFANDPAWIPPLRMAEKERISPRSNPFFIFGEAAFFVAYHDQQPVGRISAQVNRRHLQHHRDNTGHFGFFDCVDDFETAQTLINAAKTWLAARGLQRMQGPFNLTINEDTGLLISGFETTPSVLSSHASPWAGVLLERCGLTKTVDLFAYRMRPQEAPSDLARLAKLATSSGRVTLRHFDMKKYGEEVALVFDIFNDAWSDNWGFVPVCDAEIKGLTRDTRPIMRSKFGRIVEIDGKPAAMMVALPDLNPVIRDFKGRLLPINWAKLAYSVWRDRWQSARIPLLGIRKEFRNTLLAPAVLSLLVSEFLDLGRCYDLDWVEFSWVLETNGPMVKFGEFAAGAPVKIYRIYETPTSPAPGG